MAHHHLVRSYLLILLVNCCFHDIFAANQSLFFKEMTKSFTGEMLSYWNTANETNDFCIYRGVECNIHGNIEMIDISEWGLSGQLPENICRYLPELKILRLGNNDLIGSFPGGITDCFFLQELNLSSAQLHGLVPDLSPLQSLKLLELSLNSFDGEFPMSVTNLTNLELVNFKGNDGFHDWELPENISRLTKLHNMTFSSCKIHGKIPSSIGRMTSLIDINLSGNFLVGQLPPEMGQLKNLQILDLTNNQLAGEIPEEFGNMTELIDMRISDNMLSGPIPRSLLMENRLTSSSGNPTLCAPTNRNPSRVRFRLCSRIHNNKGSILVVRIGVPLILVSIGLIFYWKLWFNKAKSLNRDVVVSSFFCADVNSCHHGEIIRSLTDSNIVGFGGFGTVYKVELSNGITVAVKKLYNGICEDSEPDDHLVLDEELKIEVDTIGSIRHRNIVKLYCYFSSLEGNLLVYEYIPNGNLWDALHGGNVLLSWPTRYRIALGGAQGLAHLHHHHPAPIIHRDIKSSNILLDREFNPKVADFGLAKILEERIGNESITTGIVAGTFGYMDPEYALTNRASVKCDVYSFGVVLMELVTGRKPVEIELSGEGNHIVDWVRNNVANKEAGFEVLDRRISESFEDGMLKVLLLSLHCAHAKKASRPTMDEVVELLLRIADPLTSSEKIRNI